MRVKILLVSLCFVLSLPAAAVNWNFLRFSPTRHFTDQDWALMRTAGQEALADAADGDTEGWSNPDTGAFGTIQPVNTYQIQGMTCRLTEVYNNAGGASGTSRFDFCKQADSTWTLRQ